MPGISTPLYYPITLIAMQGHQTSCSSSRVAHRKGAENYYQKPRLYMDGWWDGLNRLWRDGVTILPRPAKKIATAKNNRPVPALEKKKKHRPVPSCRKKKKSHPVPLWKKKTTAPSRFGEKNNRPVPPRKKKNPAPSRLEQQNTPPRGWKLETNTTACLFFSLSCCTFTWYIVL